MRGSGSIPTLPLAYVRVVAVFGSSEAATTAYSLMTVQHMAASRRCEWRGRYSSPPILP